MIVIIFLILAVFFFLSLYNNQKHNQNNTKDIFIISVILALSITIIICFRDLSPEFIINCFIQGNGYHFFT